jgi:catalase
MTPCNEMYVALDYLYQQRLKELKKGSPKKDVQGITGVKNMEDTLKSVSSFDHGVSNERVVYGKGTMMEGEFQVTDNSIRDLCKAKLFCRNEGEVIKVIARVSLASAEKGSPDTTRDMRGLAIKFFTSDGEMDLLCSSIPVLFGRDPALYPAVMQAMKNKSSDNLRTPEDMWRIFSQHPESTHFTTLLFSGRGIPDGFRHMHAYPIHVFKLQNDHGKHCYVKFYLRCNQGIRNISVPVAAVLAGADPDFSIRDLHMAIRSGNFPSWTLCVQVMTEEQGRDSPFNPFDVTKVWPHSDYPLKEVGTIKFTSLPENQLAISEKIAFSPVNLVPGIDLVHDDLVHACMFSYVDTQKHRLGIKCWQTQTEVLEKLLSKQRNIDPCLAKHMEEGASHWVGKTEFVKINDFSQAGEFYRRVLKEYERERLAENLAASLFSSSEEVQRQVIDNLSNCDIQYGLKVREQLDKIHTKELKSKAMVYVNLCTPDISVLGDLIEREIVMETVMEDKGGCNINPSDDFMCLMGSIIE